ncbi:hypothetical protein HPB47_021201 [Ixodes persulcatus]|uniref:Uncharacterized protein n=1 Tax=Ixodes persulcatus TaxID=34615 RepID=A0AC60QDI1_IXOPE|nr:hypothetical protein HPB47_021201 [Ixodes persulcatus]
MKVPKDRSDSVCGSPSGALLLRLPGLCCPMRLGYGIRYPSCNVAPCAFPSSDVSLYACVCLEGCAPGGHVIRRTDVQQRRRLGQLGGSGALHVSDDSRTRPSPVVVVQCARSRISRGRGFLAARYSGNCARGGVSAAAPPTPADKWTSWYSE